MQFSHSIFCIINTVPYIPQNKERGSGEYLFETSIDGLTGIQVDLAVSCQPSTSPLWHDVCNDKDSLKQFSC